MRKLRFAQAGVGTVGNDVAVGCETVPLVDRCERSQVP